MEYKINKNLLWPVSETCLELALYCYSNHKLIPQDIQELAGRIITVYIVNQFANKDILIIDNEEILNKFQSLVTDYNLSFLVKEGMADANLTDEGWEFSLSPKGKESISKKF